MYKLIKKYVLYTYVYERQICKYKDKKRIS